jgi:hypothetical protein
MCVAENLPRTNGSKVERNEVSVNDPGALTGIDNISNERGDHVKDAGSFYFLLFLPWLAITQIRDPCHGF